MGIINNLWNRVWERKPMAQADLSPAPRPTWVVDYTDMRVVHTPDLYPSNGVYVSGDWGWRVFQPDEVFYDEEVAWCVLRKVIYQRKYALRKDWQAVMESQHIRRQFQRKVSTVGRGNPNRFFVFSPEHRQVLTVYTDQMEPVKEIIGEITTYRVTINDTLMGEFHKGWFHSTFDEAARDGHKWFEYNIKTLKGNIENIDKYLQKAMAAYRIDAVLGEQFINYMQPDNRGVTIDNTTEVNLFARNRKQLRHICQGLIKRGYVITAVYDVAGNRCVRVAWVPRFFYA